jgi:hypothetical protein
VDKPYRATRAFRAAGLCGAALAAALALSLGSCSKAEGRSAAAPRVVAITPPEASAPGEFRGAEAFARDYASSGGTAIHAVLPDAAKARDAGAVAAFIAEAAADPRVRAILVAPARAGTAEGFRRAKEGRAGGARAELLCVASGSGEDELALESSADLVVDLDRVYRAYLLPWAAKKMGAKALVAAYAREEEGDPAAVRERSIMSAASADLGLRFAAMTAPAGVGAAAFARAGTGAWLRDYGPDAALYCSDPSLVGPILAGAIAGGGIVVDAAAEATRAAYASALGLDLSSAKGDPKRELRLLEAAAAGLGEGGRLGVWDAGYAEASARGLGEYAMRVCSGAARKDELKDLVAALDARSGGAAWLADYDVDPDTGVRSANRVLLRQDVYVLGKGYLQSALQVVPSKYLALRTDAD